MLKQAKKELSLQNQICVPNPSLYCLYFAICVMFASCVICLFLCESMSETLRTMFGLSVGGVNKLFLHEIHGILSPITSHVVSHCLKVFLVCFDVF